MFHYFKENVLSSQKKRDKYLTYNIILDFISKAIKSIKKIFI